MGQGTLFHLILQTYDVPVVRDEEDWRVLGGVVADMQFWCGGRVYGCRADGSELRFALETARNTVDAMCSRIMIPFVTHLRSRYGVSGKVFRHYRAIPVDVAENRLNLVLWLHRVTPKVWTADGAYTQPGCIQWVDAKSILDEFNAPVDVAIGVYQRWRSRGVDDDIVAEFDPRPGIRRARRAVRPVGPVVDRDRRVISRSHDPAMIRNIARMVAQGFGVSNVDLYGGSRKRAIARARYVAAVISVRRGASLTAVAEVLRRQLSTLDEGVQRLREESADTFDRMEREVVAQLDGERDPTDIAREERSPDESQRRSEDELSAVDAPGVRDRYTCNHNERSLRERAGRSQCSPARHKGVGAEHAGNTVSDA